MNIIALKWEQSTGRIAAYTPFGGRYVITEYEGMTEPFSLRSEGFDGAQGDYPTLEAAKAAAQADYETRIRSALSTKLQEPVAWTTQAVLDDLKTKGYASLIASSKHALKFADSEAVALYAAPTLAHQPVTAGWNEAIDEAAKVARQYGDTKKQGQWDAAYQIADLIAALKSEGRK